jgi:hypothetical protein
MIWIEQVAAICNNNLLDNRQKNVKKMQGSGCQQPDAAALSNGTCSMLASGHCPSIELRSPGGKANETRCIGCLPAQQEV